MSNQQYQELLLDIKRQNKEAIISPYFKTNDSNKIGLSNIFYVKLKNEKDVL
jgi:hypothetical protein